MACGRWWWRGGTLPGDGFPLLLRGGRAVARWGHEFAGQRLLIEVAPFAGEALDADPAPAPCRSRSIWQLALADR